MTKLTHTELDMLLEALDSRRGATLKNSGNWNKWSALIDKVKTFKAGSKRGDLAVRIMKGETATRDPLNCWTSKQHKPRGGRPVVQTWTSPNGRIRVSGCPTSLGLSWTAERDGVQLHAHGDMLGSGRLRRFKTAGNAARAAVTAWGN